MSKFSGKPALSQAFVSTKVPFHCNNHSRNHLFHLKNEKKNICVGVKDGTEKILMVRKCDNSSTLQWLKDPVPQHSKNDGGTRIQHSSGNKMLAVDWKFFLGEYQIVLNPYNQDQRSQRWRMIVETGQLLNVEAQLCLTRSFSSNNNSEKPNNLLLVMDICSKNNQKILAQQSWSLVNLYQNV